MSHFLKKQNKATKKTAYQNLVARVNSRSMSINGPHQNDSQNHEVSIFLSKASCFEAYNEKQVSLTSGTPPRPWS